MLVQRLITLTEVYEILFCGIIMPNINSVLQMLLRG